MPILRSAAAGLVLGLVLTGGVAPAGAQTLEIIHAFTKDKPLTGDWPAWAPTELVRGEGGRLYGATRYGGGGCSVSAPYNTCGVVFELDPVSGTFRVIHDFGTVRDAQQEVRLTSI